ncbi:MAG: N-acyl homoserine lactonase family protein [Sphingomonas bacterium]|nr:N-acyl homoserine lactonase family protein [Sphingomonas bacterium]
MLILGIVAALTLSAGASAQPRASASAQPRASASIGIVRLDCGNGTVKNFDAFFSDTHEYPAGPRVITDSCYLVRHGSDYLLWDTGFPAAIKGKSNDMGAIVARLDKTIPEQLAVLRLTPSDIDVVGISHMHGDHVGQAADFPGAKLLIGKKDLDLSKGPEDPFGPWRGAGARVQPMDGGDVDVFGDGSVIALNLPGHTPGHMALLVKLASGNVMLTGDLYHSTIARQLKGVPPFNSSRAETLASIDRFERLARSYRAKVIIQHEPADIVKLPAFPREAR